VATARHSLGIAARVKLCFDVVLVAGGCTMDSLSQESSSWPHPSLEPAGGCGLHWGLSDGHAMRTWKCSSCPHHGRTFDSQERSAPASRHIAFLIAGLTKTRVTTGSWAAARTSAVPSCVHTFGSTAVTGRQPDVFRPALLSVRRFAYIVTL
jgi:hypothetical protein